MAEEVVRCEIREGIAVAHFDDGKANVLSADSVAALDAHLDRAEKQAAAVLIAGRPGMLSGGFDLSVMRSGPENAYRLVKAGAELFLRFLEFPRPIVVAATGHAIAAGMTLPHFALELARQRLSKRHFVRATTQAELYTPEAAVDAGYLDRVTSPDEVLDAALAEAARLGALPQPAFGVTKRSAHADFAANLRDTLAADLKGLMGLA